MCFVIFCVIWSCCRFVVFCHVILGLSFSFGLGLGLRISCCSCRFGGCGLSGFAILSRTRGGLVVCTCAAIISGRHRSSVVFGCWRVSFGLRISFRFSTLPFWGFWFGGVWAACCFSFCLKVFWVLQSLCIKLWGEKSFDFSGLGVWFFGIDFSKVLFLRMKMDLGVARSGLRSARSYKNGSHKGSTWCLFKHLCIDNYFI